MATLPKTYCCIDLKSFYASAECVARGKDPFTHCLVVADPTRSQNTIVLAASPAIKRYGVPSRCRLRDIPSNIEYEIARPRMQLYMEVSAQIIGIYLHYVSAQDMHVYSVDECFIDLTPYLKLYRKDARTLVKFLKDAVFAQTGITATAGIGPNLFLAKVALDVLAKHKPDGIAVLTETSFRREIWHHRPITDIWNVGPGIARRLEKYGVEDLFGVAQMNPDILYDEFGMNAEFLIDHAWGVEPCTIEEIHDYRPQSTSYGNGCVLMSDYTFEEARMVVRELTDESALELVHKRVVVNSVSLYIGYSSSRKEEESRSGRKGYAHATRQIEAPTNSFHYLADVVDDIYVQIVDDTRLVRRVSVSFGDLISENFATPSLFGDEVDNECGSGKEAEEEERQMQETILAIKDRFGRDKILKGTAFKEKATGLARTRLIGGHNAK